MTKDNFKLVMKNIQNEVKQKLFYSSKTKGQVFLMIIFNSDAVSMMLVAYNLLVSNVIHNQSQRDASSLWIATLPSKFWKLT